MTPAPDLSQSNGVRHQMRHPVALLQGRHRLVTPHQ